MLEVVKGLESLAHLFQEPTPTQEVEGWIEPLSNQEAADNNSTGVGTDFIKATAEHGESESGKLKKHCYYYYLFIIIVIEFCLRSLGYIIDVLLNPTYINDRSLIVVASSQLIILI